MKDFVLVVLTIMLLGCMGVMIFYQIILVKLEFGYKHKIERHNIPSLVQVGYVLSD